MAICQSCQIPTKGHVSCHWQEHSWSSQRYWAPWRSQIWFGRCHWVECRASLAPHIFSDSQPPLRPAGRFDERRYSSLAPEGSPWAPPVTTLMEIDCYLATPSLSSELTTSHILPSVSHRSDGRLPPILFNLPCHHFSAFTFSHLFPCHHLWPSTYLPDIAHVSLSLFSIDITQFAIFSKMSAEGIFIARVPCPCQGTVLSTFRVLCLYSV